MYTITVPVKPFVAKYICARYQALPWEINKGERIGKIIYNMLERMPKRDGPKMPELGASIDIKVSYWYANAKGVYLSKESVIEFNDFIRLELIEEILDYMHKINHGIGIKKYRELFITQQSASGKTKRRVITNPSLDQYFENKEIINDIFAQYDITEDDYPFENIKKDLQRMKLPKLSA
jgi:hypothetical protein